MKTTAYGNPRHCTCCFSWTLYKASPTVRLGGRPRRRDSVAIPGFGCFQRRSETSGGENSRDEADMPGTAQVRHNRTGLARSVPVRPSDSQKQG